MPRKTSTSKAQASKAAKAKAAPRRSSSHFTNPSDALLMSDERPSCYIKQENGEFDVFAWVKGKWAYRITTASESSARRARAKIDAEMGFAPTQAAINKARAAREKARG